MFVASGRGGRSGRSEPSGAPAEPSGPSSWKRDPEGADTWEGGMCVLPSFLLYHLWCPSV